MDPNATLDELTRLLVGTKDTTPERWDMDDDYAVERAAELFDALDAWLSGGGFLPDMWKNSR